MLIRKKSLAQSMVETAILGPLVLVALGIMVTYIVKLNGDQYMLMEAFRQSLKKAHDDNKAAGYGTWDDRRQTKVEQPIIGDKVATSGAGHILWAVNDVTGQGEDPEDELFAKLNWIEYQLPDNVGSTSVEPTYFTGTYENISVNQAANHVSSTRSAGYGEGMIYKIGGDQGMTVGQGRGHGRVRGMSGG